ncbi:MAG: formate dehydrogenase major subunit [Actinomycetota bacterium]|nr:formate dehydrogenase major subunit [Actinomycetota bacterium]
MAECHPVGFQWVVEAKERGATIIHVDPRFTRTSALADIHVPLRAGSDIAFLGGIVNYILTQGREFRDYVVPYTNAATIVDERFRDTEDLDGFFSGWDAEKNQYEITTWQYAGVDLHAASGIRKTAAGGEMTGAGGGSGLDRAEPPERDPTLSHPRCVFQLLKRHYSRYTPEMVEEICGVPRELFLRVADALCENSGRERTGAFCYAVGWTQHTVGVQYIRTAAVIQLLLGNIGRPGGGILALRGHASIQGSTDIPTLYDLLPGYIPMPHSGESWDLASYVDNHASKGGYWAHFGHYAVSLLKAWWGEHATADNDFCWDYLPRISEGHSAYDTALAMLDGKVRGYMLLGENPAVGSANSRLHRLALAELDWLVVRDFTEIESAAFWHSGPEIETGELRTDDIGTEVFFLPAAAHTEKDGSFTNTQRLLQWHEAAVEPPGDCRSDLWFMYHLGRIIREKLASSTDERDRPVLNLTWDYPTKGRIDEPDSEAVLREINGWDAEGHPLSASTELKGDGSTTCGCWIYCGCFAGGENGARRRRRKDGDHIAPEWGWAWPANRRMLYNRASADPDGKPWSERKRYLWWDADAGKWTGDDVPDFKVDLAPDHRPEDGATGPEALAGDQPFIMQDDGVAWLYVPTGLKDGPMPTHYEPHESPVSNPLYSQGVNPARERYPRPENPDQPVDGEPGAERYPYVMTTYRLTEHHTAGGMSRTVPHLLELQPEMFCEVSPVLAAERGLENGGWATIVTARTAIEARVLVTERIPALRVRGRVVHQVGLPYHFGFAGIATGDSANDLFPIVLDPNVHIQEVKAATCDVVAGRRPRGPQLREFVADHGRGVPR